MGQWVNGSMGQWVNGSMGHGSMVNLEDPDDES